MPKIDSTIVCWRRGKVSSRIDCDSGTIGAPAPPWTMRHSTSISSDCAVPHSRVASVNHPTDHTMTRFPPKRATSQPVIGVTTAVARMLNVMVQAISSWVADIAPCICGRMVEVVRMRGGVERGAEHHGGEREVALRRAAVGRGAAGREGVGGRTHVGGEGVLCESNLAYYLARRYTAPRAEYG